MIMKLLALIPLLIIIILVMLVVYFHTMAIKERIKYNSFNISTLIYDVFVYMLAFAVIGFCIYYIISI